MKKALKILCALALTLTLASGALAATVADFTVKSIDGKDFTAASLKGKKSVLIFLQAACGQCRGEVAEAKAKGKELQAKAEVYYVIVDVNTDRAMEYFKEQGLPGTLIADPNFDMGAAMEVNATPSTVVVDKDLNIVKSKTGYRGGDLARLISEL